MANNTFVRAQRDAQKAYFARTLPAEQIRPDVGWRLVAGGRDLNIASQVRASAVQYFSDHRITWHRHANHGLSSQICCLNFLLPLATQPEVLAKVIGAALSITPPKMLPIEPGPNGEPWYVGFEWTGLDNYLSEWADGAKSATRGANATSADAVVRFEANGVTETVLIEWKYTEKYGAPLDPKGNPTRVARYADKAFAPEGPIRSDLGLSVEDFFWEPFYQLMRQQILASRMQAARETDASRVRVLHISPSGNTSLHRVTAPKLRQFGSDAFAAFSAVLVDPTAFVPRTTSEVFRQAITANLDDGHAKTWAGYLDDRYCFLRE